MKTQHNIKWYPLDIKKDEDGGLWFYVPRWIVRAFRLKDYGTNMGKVAFDIHRDKRAIIEYRHEQESADKLFKENWCTKLRREDKKRHLKEKD